MKITIEHCDVPENEIILRCPELDDEMLHILALLKSQNQRICALDENKDLTFLSPNDVLYAESVDEKTFLYCENIVYRTSLSLSELSYKYENIGFFRIGKATVVNLHRILNLKSQTDGRIEATLQNKEKLIISRHYAPLLRQQLGV